MASITINALSNTYNANSNANKIEVLGSVLILGNNLVSNTNPIPVTGTTGSSGNTTVVLQTGNTMYTNNQVTVTNSASLIASANANFIHREFINTTNTVVYIGGSNTITGNSGYPIFANGVYDFSRYPGPLYGITNSATSQNVATMQY